MVALGVATAAREVVCPIRSVIVWDLFLLEKLSWEAWIFMSASLCSVRVRVTGERVHSRSYRPMLNKVEVSIRLFFLEEGDQKNTRQSLAFCMFPALMVSVALFHVVRRLFCLCSAIDTGCCH